MQVGVGVGMGIYESINRIGKTTAYVWVYGYKGLELEAKASSRPKSSRDCVGAS